MRGFSIVIAAYKADKYLEECISSIVRQKCERPKQIIIAVDHCRETLKEAERLKRIFSKKDITILWMLKNYGWSVCRNTAINYAKYDKIITFDSDDYFLPSAFMNIEKYCDIYDVVRFYQCKFDDKTGEKGKIGINPSMSCFDRSVFDKLGGYKPIRITADSEFKSRYKGHFSVYNIGQVLFMRRIHDDNLTVLIPHGSKERQSLLDSYPKRTEKVIKIERQIGKHERI